MTFELPKLNYDYDALEPYFDARTMEIHHSKHHKAYTDKFNAALEKHPELFEKSAEEIIADIDSVPKDIQTAVKNNGGGYINHKLFWEILKKDVNISDSFKKTIEEAFGSYEKFKEEFSQAAATQFGSGWAWLVTETNGKLSIMNTANQESPLSKGLQPILCLDVWEHSYYLKFQNKRPEYIEAFFNVINWDVVEEKYNQAKK